MVVLFSQQVYLGNRSRQRDTCYWRCTCRFSTSFCLVICSRWRIRFCFTVFAAVFTLFSLQVMWIKRCKVLTRRITPVNTPRLSILLSLVVVLLLSFFLLLPSVGAAFVREDVRIFFQLKYPFLLLKHKKAGNHGLFHQFPLALEWRKLNGRRYYFITRCDISLRWVSRQNGNQLLRGEWSHISQHRSKFTTKAEIYPEHLIPVVT